MMSATRQHGSLGVNRDPAFIETQNSIRTLASSSGSLLLLYVPGLCYFHSSDFLIIICSIYINLFSYSLQHKELCVSAKYSGSSDVTRV